MKRSGPPERRTPLQPGKGLQRGEPMQRTGSLTRSEMSRKPTDRLEESRATYAEVREAVFMRDGGSCVRCGRRGEQTHHRLPRGMGGSSRNPDTHDPMALITVCVGCHNWIEANRAVGGEAERMGYIVRHGDIDLASIPVRWHGKWCELTPGCTVLPDADPPPGELL